LERNTSEKAAAASGKKSTDDRKILSDGRTSRRFLEADKHRETNMDEALRLGGEVGQGSLFYPFQAGRFFTKVTHETRRERKG